MILILSQENEKSTDQVMDWLDYYEAKYKRINGSYFVNNVTLKSGELRVEGLEIDKVGIVWNRRWGAAKESFDHLELGLSNKICDEIGFDNAYKMLRNLNNEISCISLFFFRLLAQKKWITDYFRSSVNKLSILKSAAECGFDIPEYIVTSNTALQNNFTEKYAPVITKPLSEVLSMGYDGYSCISLVGEISKRNIEMRHDIYYPTFLQRAIAKRYELRVFYWYRQIFTTIIFSQEDDQTRYDYRNYNTMNPNRTLPYNLPEDIKQNLINLMESIGQGTGSIDIIRGEDSKYYFLEINPIGQFGMVSHPNNCYLHKIIAKYLYEQDLESNK